MNIELSILPQIKFPKGQPIHLPRHHNILTQMPTFTGYKFSCKLLVLRSCVKLCYQSGLLRRKSITLFISSRADRESTVVALPLQCLQVEFIGVLLVAEEGVWTAASSCRLWPRIPPSPPTRQRPPRPRRLQCIRRSLHWSYDLDHLPWIITSTRKITKMILDWSYTVYQKIKPKCFEVLWLLGNLPDSRYEPTTVCPVTVSWRGSSQTCHFSEISHTLNIFSHA